jgi:hypothetical protein
MVMVGHAQPLAQPLTRRRRAPAPAAAIGAAAALPTTCRLAGRHPRRR